MYFNLKSKNKNALNYLNSKIIIRIGKIARIFCILILRRYYIINRAHMQLQFASRIATNWSFDGLKIGQAIQTLTTILSAASENLNPLWSRRIEGSSSSRIAQKFSKFCHRPPGLGNPFFFPKAHRLSSHHSSLPSSHPSSQPPSQLSSSQPPNKTHNPKITRRSRGLIFPTIDPQGNLDKDQTSYLKHFLSAQLEFCILGYTFAARSVFQKRF